MNPFAKSSRYTGNVLCGLMLASALIGGSGILSRAQAQAVKSDDTTEYTIKKRVFKSGEVNHYKMTMKNQIGTPMGDQTIAIDMKFKETTQSVKPTGELAVLNEFESAVANINGTEQNVLSILPTVTVTRDKEGKVSTKTEGGNDQANAQIAGLFQQFVSSQDNYLPKNAIKVGDKWKFDVSTPSPAGGDTKIKGESSLVGTEPINGIKSLKMKVTADSANETADVKGHLEYLFNIDAETGKVLRMIAKTDATAMGNKINQELEMTLLPNDTKADKK